jgi:hypothetical protein
MYILIVYVVGHIVLNVPKSDVLFWVFDGDFKFGFWTKFLTVEILNKDFIEWS